MKILSHKMYDFYTNYKVEYKGTVYDCNYNGGLPKLNGIKLKESLRVDLANVIEDFFLSSLEKYQIQ